MFSDCEGVIVMTDAERDFIAARGGHDIHVAGCGVDASHFDRRDGASIRARYNLGDRPIIGFVGRQDARKGAATVVEAMPLVWKHSPDAVLLFAGQSAHRDPAVSAAIDSLAPEERGKLVFIDDFADAELPSIMDACDVLTLPSVHDSFGLVFLEAWVCGKPVIGADVPATRCVIENGVDGLLVQPFKPTDLAEKILDLINDPAKRAAFGERGRQKVLARYTWDRVTDAWEAAFQKAAAVSRRSA
jgi:glycosyltransferase involved in cell wall biosynthesis